MGSTCDLVADGRSTVPVEVCLAEEVTEPAAGLSANLTLSAGKWLNATDPTNPSRTQVKLSGEGCALPSFVAGTTAEVVRIDGELAGFTVQKYVTLAPAPLDSLEMVPTPPRLEEGLSNEVRLTVTVRAKGLGKPSAGTRVAFSVGEALGPIAAETPAAFFYPESTLIDPATGTASGTLEILGAVQSVKVLVTATAPEGAEGAPGASIGGELQLTVVPSM